MELLAEATGRRFGLGTALRATLVLSLVALAACNEPDNILPGKRESVDAILSDVPGDVPEEEFENRSAPVAVPPARTNASWPQRHGTPATRVGNAALSARPSLIWSANIGAGDSRKARITADPVVAGGRVFALDSAARVTAVTTAGATVWNRDLTPPNDRSGDATGGGLAYGDGKLFVTTGFGLLTALDPATGQILWEQDLDASGTGSPTVAGDLVYVVSGDATAWAIDTANGRVRWQMSATPSRNNLLGGPAPAVTDDLVIFAHSSGEVQAVTGTGGVQTWGALVAGRRPNFAKSVVGDISGDPVVAGGRVYVGVQSGVTVALDAETGERLWSVQEGAMSPVWAVGDGVFLMSDLNEIVRVSAETGERVWAHELPLFVKDRPRRQREVHAHYGPILAGGRLVVASSDGLLRIFDPASGEVAGQVEIPGGATSNPVVAGGTLYVVSQRGQLLAFR
ncbi:PQQ enzyme repeat family protein [Pseudooceanicola batsensis HTCC2597]|uniref:PQQ enzyme repeat family protein n=1 Tax=Pseudooceanicola batsensis (strain ATCC BAA-863 / DSM 15984 / KCTC 12145 / HTCC2597) TaxID=252305 RepID=A3U3T2_PSEBH|nr:PQQ-binding-like beta-propeller repeat protein [Pseudooceanicola batsensis]EAQ01171.1 PQQ enzyme repeat family protein [Pseudooceanicola batsensis HTCC2597]